MTPTGPERSVETEHNGTGTLATATVSCWSIVPVLLKPDALTGDATHVGGLLAADFAALLSARLRDPVFEGYQPFVTTSLQGAARAKQHSDAEMKAIWWYTPEIKDLPGCHVRLHELHDKWKDADTVPVAQIIADASVALGFAIAVSVDRALTQAECLAFYRDTDQPDMHEKMQRFMVGQTVRFMLLCGQQENAALQLMKTYLRYVMRYPAAKRQIQNWIHVTNPDASNYPELLRMYSAE